MKNPYNESMINTVFGKAETILSSIKEEVLNDNIEVSRFYKRGFKDGQSLIADISFAEADIAQLYEGYLSIINLQVQADYLKYTKLLATVEYEIEHYDEILDKEDEYSKLSFIKKRIARLHKELEDYEQRIDESDFIEQQNKLYEAKIGSDLGEIRHLIEKRNEIYDILRQEIILLKDNIELIKHSKSDKEAIHHKIHAIKELIEMFPFLVPKKEKKKRRLKNLWGLWSSNAKVKITYPPKNKRTVYQKIEDVADKIEERFDKLNDYLKNSKPFTATKGQLRLNLVIAFLILFGEVYIVYKFITRAVGLYIQSPSNVGDYIQFFFSLLFSLAYPFAIGFIFKKYLQKIKFKHQKDFYRAGAWLIGIGLLMAAPIAAMEILKLIPKESNTSSGNLTLTLFRLITTSLFLPILTLLFSIAGTIALQEVMEAFKRYNSIYRLNRSSKKSKKLMKQYKEQIAAEENSIHQLYEQRSKLKEKQAEFAAVKETLEAPHDYTDFIKGLAKLAVSIYRTGYNAGRAAYLKDCNEDEIIIFYLKQKYVQHESKQSKHI